MAEGRITQEQLSRRRGWVRLVSVVAQQRPAARHAKRPPRMAEGRITQEQLSRRRGWVNIIRDVFMTL
ncbi:MAG: hypothetical protein ACJA13_003436, partial [Paraglaciecola sp.]